MSNQHHDPKAGKETSKTAGSKALTKEEMEKLKTAVNKAWLVGDKAPKGQFKEVK